MFVNEFNLLIDSKAKLRKLRDDLLDRNRWPEDFEWDYSNCKKCAMALGGFMSIVPFFDTSLPEFFNISREDAIRIFWTAHVGRNCLHKEVTPEMVAKEIAKLL